MFKTFLLIISLLIGNVFSAGVIYKDTVPISVTFYDHFSPEKVEQNYCDVYTEFNMSSVRGTSQPVKGMVKDTLDVDGKPVFNKIHGLYYPKCLSTQKGYCDGCGWFNKNIHTWFRPQIDSSVPVSVIEDTLKFIHKGNGMYEFYNWNFYPLDNHPKSLVSMGIEKLNNKSKHNLGFCLHYKDKIKYDKIDSRYQVFKFMGDDDAWVFLNNILVLDLGGIHYASNDEFNLGIVGEKLGLKHGNVYNFDFFYCERREVESHIRITTNIGLFSNRLKYFIIK